MIAPRLREEQRLSIIQPEQHAGELPIIIDVEASGFGRGSYPIEVGFVMPNGSTYCTLIRPEAGWQHWSAEAEEIHGMSRQLIESRGRPVDEVARWLNHTLQGQHIYSDAWSHDLSWLGKLFDAAELHPSFHLEALQTLLSEQQLCLWRETRDQVVLDLNIHRHRASADALIIQQIYRRTREAEQQGLRVDHPPQRWGHKIST